MKKYNESKEVNIISGYEARYMEENKIMIDVKMIVWVGSSKYWSKVFLNTNNHRLYVRTDKHTFEPIETLNISKIEQL